MKCVLRDKLWFGLGNNVDKDLDMSESRFEPAEKACIMGMSDCPEHEVCSPHNSATGICVCQEGYVRDASAKCASASGNGFKKVYSCNIIFN